MKKEYNICDLMRSKDMREYYRNIELSIEEKILIIKSCYHPITKQLLYLKYLLNEVNNIEDEKMVKDMINLYELMITLFFNPKKIYPNNRIFYIVEEYKFLCNKNNNLSIMDKLDTYTTSFDLYEDINDIIKDIKKYNADSNNRFDISLFVITGENIVESISFSCSNIDNIFEPFNCIIDLDQLHDYKYLNDALNIYTDTIYRFNIPFNHGDKLKIKIPGMENPIYGILWKEKDLTDCWYNFLCETIDDKYCGDSLDLSYIGINLNPDYCKFDWLEKQLNN